MSESAENEEEEDDKEEVYEFVATGENTCERCAALNGTLWQEPPNPPHAHCECEVQPRLGGYHARRDCGDNRWTVEALPGGEGTVRYGPAEDSGQEWGFNIEIDCWDGLIHEFEIWVDMGKDSDWPANETGFDDMGNFAWSELYDEVEAVAAQVCRPCPDLIVS